MHSAPEGFYFQASNGSVALPVAGYIYNSDWTPLLAGLSPPGMTACPAAPEPSGRKHHETSFDGIGARRHLGNRHDCDADIGARSVAPGLGLGPRWLGAGLDHWCGAIASGLCLWLRLPGLLLWVRLSWLRLRLSCLQLRQLRLRLSCLQLRQLRLWLSGLWLRLWRRLLPASLSLRLL